MTLVIVGAGQDDPLAPESAKLTGALIGIRLGVDVRAEPGPADPAP